jgi:molybdopterin molybdotransferase/putative molybdopterin biosynthesis protein
MDHPPRSVPRAAYAQWTEACARAGWLPRHPAGTAERVPLADALDRVAAEPVTARWPSPRSDCAAMDGIAINSGKFGRRGAGEAARVIAPGDFSWIDTGDPMPADADAVIMREHVTIDEAGAAHVSDGPGITPGRHVRKLGEDFTRDEILVPAGRRLDPACLAVAAAAGRTAIAVAPKPRVAVIPTGDEIVPAGRAPKPGEIIDSNSLYLAARCARAGAIARVSDIVPDDPDRLAAEIRRAAADADLVLVIAGSSRGRGDHTAAVLAQVGGLTVAGIAVRPGHPALLGHAKSHASGTVPVIGLPGYPLATAVIFELLAVPLLATLDGDATPPRRETARLARDWGSSPAVEDWIPVVLAPDGTATPVRHGAGSTSQLARASAWWAVPIGQGHFSAGAEITVLPWT